jgi:hypothetical protein
LQSATRASSAGRLRSVPETPESSWTPTISYPRCFATREACPLGARRLGARWSTGRRGRLGGDFIHDLPKDWVDLNPLGEPTRHPREAP